MKFRNKSQGLGEGCKLVEMKAPPPLVLGFLRGTQKCFLIIIPARWWQGRGTLGYNSSAFLSSQKINSSPVFVSWSAQLVCSLAPRFTTKHGVMLGPFFVCVSRISYVMGKKGDSLRRCESIFQNCCIIEKGARVQQKKRKEKERLQQWAFERSPAGWLSFKNRFCAILTMK